jgi:hypothetical protein
MNRITIITKLRAVAAITPAVVLIVALIAAGAFYIFGATPRAIYETQYASARAADGMESALFKMDWGRNQPDGGQIVVDQQRRFVSWVDTARARADSEEQLDRLQKIAAASVPVFDSLRKAAPGDESVEPSMQNLEGLVADLSSADEASMLTVASRAESQARLLILILIVGAIVVPWVCFVAFFRMSGQAGENLREMRRNCTTLADRGAADAPELKSIDERLTQLGFPPPNPMLAEE